ncbi:DUF106 domain-containing protein [Candidatus Woesearchaeota archaeon]|nr:DUF106 domain-containing protein [Candidatus Woesearchaeota archaeon]
MTNFLSNFLLSLDPFISIFLVSLFISLLSTLAFKFFTNQKEMKRLRDEAKEHQNKAKEHQKKGNQSEMLREQQEAMDLSMQTFKHSMKPSLITMLPIIFIFGWMNVNMAFMNIEPSADFSVFAVFDEIGGTVLMEIPDELTLLTNASQDVKAIQLTDDARDTLIDKNRALSDIKKKDSYNVAIWRLNGPAGTYNLTIHYDNLTVTKDLIISETRHYANPVKVVKSFGMHSIIIGNERIIFNVLGLKIGWLGTYIILSLVFGNVLRKLLKVA